MAISSSTRKAGPFIGNDATTVFPFAFKVFTSADLRVVRTNALGVESDLVLDTDYTVALNANQDNDPGGTVTRATALPTGERLTITSDVEALQPLVLTNNGGFYPRVINDAFDKITIIAQQLIEQVGRSLKLPISSTASATLPDPVANRLIAWNSSANGFTNVDPASIATVAAYADASIELFDGNGTQTAFTLAEDPAVLANLDVSISGVVQVGGEDFTWIGTTLTFVVAPPTGTRIQVRYTRAIPPVDLAAAVAAAEADRVATAADRVQTGLDRVATAADRVQTGLDRVATAADRVQTGLDAVATAADRAQTGLDRIATAADVAATADKVAATALAASTGAALVGSIQLGTGADARTVQSKLRDVFSAKDFGATGDGVTNDRAAIQEAIDAVSALADGGDVVCPPGVYVLGSTTLNVGAKVILVLNGAELTSTATNAVQVSLGSLGQSGGIRGSGAGSSIVHSGSGAGVLLDGAGESQADPFLSDFSIVGSSAGAAGVLSKKFNRMVTNNIRVYGYTTGAAFKSEGSNSITHMNPSVSTCLYGVHNLTLVSSGNFTSNAIKVFGGQLTYCTGWGWYEATTGGGGRNLSNAAIGVTFEQNGVDASGTTGDIFNNNCDQLAVESCYFENRTGTVPTNCITIGDGTEAPKGTRVVGNLFVNTNTNTINDVSGSGTFVQHNVQNGANTNFLQHGANARLLYLGPDRIASTNYFAGLDNGLDSTIVSAGPGTGLNQYGATIRGFGFNTISGLNQDFTIRGRGGGTNVVAFQAIDGTGIGQMSDAGALNVSASYSVAGTKVVGAQGAAVADATGGAVVDAEARTALNALLARLRTHGLIAT